MFPKGEGCGSVIHCAVKFSRLENVNFLLGRGRVRDVGNPNGLTPLDLAKKKEF